MLFLRLPGCAATDLILLTMSGRRASSSVPHREISIGNIRSASRLMPFQSVLTTTAISASGSKNHFIALSIASTARRRSPESDRRCADRYSCRSCRPYAQCQAVVVRGQAASDRRQLSRVRGNVGEQGSSSAASLSFKSCCQIKTASSSTRRPFVCPAASCRVIITSRQSTVLRPIASSSEHLARHRLADLFLDTLPYNARPAMRCGLVCR